MSDKIQCAEARSRSRLGKILASPATTFLGHDILKFLNLEKYVFSFVLFRLMQPGEISGARTMLDGTRVGNNLVTLVKSFAAKPF